MSITGLLPVLKAAGKNKDAFLEDGLDPRAHAQRHANTGIGLGKKAATAPLRAWENIPRLVVRGLQLVLAIIIVGIYGNRVDDFRKEGRSQAPEWLFGVFVAGLSCVTAVVFAVAAPFGNVSGKFRTYRLFSWDLTLFLLWIVIFGIFGAIFIHRKNDDSYKGSSTVVEKGAVWVDLVNALLWLISGVYGCLKVFLGGKVDSLGGKVTGKLFGRKEETNKMGMYERY